MDDIRDIKPPVDVPGEFWWIWIVVAIIVLAALGVWLWLKRRRQAAGKGAPSQPPWEIALHELDHVAAQPYLAQGDYKTYYSRISDVVRRYLEDQLNIKAPEMTT